MPVLLFDGTAIAKEMKGVGKYSYHLLNEINKNLHANWKIYVLVFRDDISRFPNNDRVIFIHKPYCSDLYKGYIILPSLIKKLNPDVLLTPMEAILAPVKINRIAVCHDINELLWQAEQYNAGIFRTSLNKLSQRLRITGLKRCNKIICNSIFVMEEVARRYVIPDDKLFLGYCGIDDVFREVANKHTDRNSFVSRNYVLTFATGDTRENYDLLPGIMHHIKKNGKKIFFIIAGVNFGSAYFELLRDECKEYGILEGVDYLFNEFLPENKIDELAQLYCGADFYLELSLHEGFGMQLAEAMACGRPCISSAQGALREVGGEYTVNLMNLDAKSVAKVIVESYENALHERTFTEQQNFTKKYSWEKLGKEVSTLIGQYI